MVRKLSANNSFFEILEPLGEGLNSRVFKAFRIDSQTQVQQLLALKLIKNTQKISILKQEFHILQKIRSPFCVQVLGWESFANQVGLSMEYIEGVSLYELCRHLSLTPNISNEIVRQVYQGLLDLKEEGLFHGDLHPKNILLDIKGRVKLVDFGLQESEPGKIVGNPKYLSTDRWESQVPNFSSDLYALGLIEYELQHNLITQSLSLAACKQRAWNLRETSFLLKKNHSFNYDSDKSKLTYSPSPEAQLQLALFVKEILQNKQLACSTQIISQPIIPQPVIYKWPTYLTKTKSYLAFCWAAVCVLCLPLSISAIQKQNDSTAYRLEIRTEKWSQVYINGQYKGFTPLYLKSWNGKILNISLIAKGEVKAKRFELGQESFHLLTDQDFK